MGIIRELSFEDVKKWLKKHYDIALASLSPTDSGISDTTYMLTAEDGKRYILKHFEVSSFDEIIQEHNLLGLLKKSALPVSIPVSSETIYLLNERPTSLYTVLDGHHPKKTEISHIRELAKFLADFHILSSDRISTNPTIQKRLEANRKIIESSPFKEYGYLLDMIMDEPVDGVIHTDIFPDNTLFLNDRLTGVIDFIEACNGNFAFDLGVVAFSFCFEKERPDMQKIQTLADEYRKNSKKKNISINELLKNTAYAAFFYGIQRHTRSKQDNGLIHKNTKESLDKLYYMSSFIDIG